jgi:putative transposase
VIQRGNNRQRVFHDDADRNSLLELLSEYAAREKVAIHSYVLMDNHFHLLLTPETAAGLPAVMQAVGRRYVRYFNRRYQRSGTLWEGRYRSAPVQSERYLLACMVYIDLNPVRAGIVARVGDYPWSSYGHYAGLRPDKRITAHPLYWQLGNTPFEREARYVEQVAQGLTAKQQQQLTESALKNWALGESEFVASLEKQTGRRTERARAGRPARSGPGAADHR